MNIVGKHFSHFLPTFLPMRYFLAEERWGANFWMWWGNKSKMFIYHGERYAFHCIWLQANLMFTSTRTPFLEFLTLPPYKKTSARFICQFYMLVCRVWMGMKKIIRINANNKFLITTTIIKREILNHKSTEIRLCGMFSRKCLLLSTLVNVIHAFFFISNGFFRPRLKCCLTKSKIP